MNSPAIILPRTQLKQNALKTQLLNTPEIKQLFRKLDDDQLLAGAGLVYISHDLTSVRLREFRPICRKDPVHVVIHQIPAGESHDIYGVKLTQNRRESRLVSEAVGSVLSCSAAVLGWLVVVGSGAAVPVSGGLSSTVSILAWSAATASTVQCANSAVRTVSELRSGEASDWLDSLEWYDETMRALDVISLAGAATAALTAFKAYGVVRSASSRSLKEILQGMSRSERKRMTEEIIRINHPGVSNKLLKQMIRSGLYPARYSSSSINSALMLHVKDTIGATLSFTGSASTGALKDVVIGVYEEEK